jgi:peroxiredoxin
VIPWPWPAPRDDGAADHLVKGRRLPDLALPATTGGTISPAATEGRCILIIYPWTGVPDQPNPSGWDDIPGAHGSTPQLLGFARLHHGFREVGVRLIGLSGQTAAEQAAFAIRHDVPFPLLSDAASTFREAVSLPTFHTGGETFLKRITLVLRDGVIEKKYYPVHPPDSHGREVMYLCGATRPGANLGR